jgi:hypothetical protein
VRAIWSGEAIFRISIRNHNLEDVDEVTLLSAHLQSCYAWNLFGGKHLLSQCAEQVILVLESPRSGSVLVYR